MTTFDDLEFHHRYQPEEYAILEESSPRVFAELRDAQYAHVAFPNGYGASVLFGSLYYSNGIDTYELAILDPHGVSYDTHITSDVIGHISKDEVTHILQQIEDLPLYSKD